MSLPAASARSQSAASRAAYRCTECGWQATKWVGRCGECQTWGTVDEFGAQLRKVTATPVALAAQ
jgi:DNA repair protein RadA/Sms